MNDSFADHPLKDTIRLDHFLKITGLAETGGQAKQLIQAGEILVNGAVETRRRCQLKPGDLIEYNGEQIEVVSVSADDEEDF